MTSMTLRLDGQSALLKRLRAVGDPKPLLRAIVTAGVQESKALVPRRTGNLARTIRIGAVTDDYAELVAGGRRDVGYAAAVEFGTGPRTIVPRRAKVLAWGGQRTLGGRLRSGQGATHFARRVRHPGTRAKPYLRPGLARAVDRVGSAVLIDQWNRGA